MTITQLEQIAAEALALVPAEYRIEQCQWCQFEPGCAEMTADFGAMQPDPRARRPEEMPHIKIPDPGTPYCLAILLHEVGHVVCKHPNNEEIFGMFVRHGRDKERQASQWAIDFAAARGYRFSTEITAELWHYASEYEQHYDASPFSD